MVCVLTWVRHIRDAVTFMQSVLSPRLGFDATARGAYRSPPASTTAVVLPMNAKHPDNRMCWRRKLTYEVDALRALMLAGGSSTYGIGLDLGVLLLATVALVLVGGRLYPNVVQ